MPYAYPISVLVTSAGATIEAVDGLKIVIPPNAVSRSFTLNVAAPIVAPNVSGLTEVSRSYGITPDGLAFGRNITIFVPYFSAYESQRSQILVYLAADPTEPNPTGWTPTTPVLTLAGKVGGLTATLHSAMAAIP